MLMTLERDDERLISDPPALPPFLRDGPERKPRCFIMPDISRAEIRTKTVHDNCYTIHYSWMMRIWGAYESVEVTHVNTRLYRQWLETYRTEHGIPPHIQFGGAVEANPKGDPTFHQRWVEYARSTFA
jgi:hypothetical protein